MIICGVDFETTGLNLVTDRVVETGVVLWDTELKAPVRVEGFLVYDPDVHIPEEATKVHGITDALVQAHGVSPAEAFKRLRYAIGQADACCAHNGVEFDKPMYESWFERQVKKPPDPLLWIDTRVDLPIPGGRLSYMAADHGFLNPFPHRAVTDVLTMLRILNEYDVNEVIRRAKLPCVVLRALVSYDDRQLAKDRGFHWKGKLEGWRKTVKEDKVQEEVSSASFQVQIC